MITTYADLQGIWSWGIILNL